MTKFVWKRILYGFIVCSIMFAIFTFLGCDAVSKGKYFVDSEYIISTASLTSIVRNEKGEIEYYGIDINHESDIKLNYIKYKCELYSNSKVIETFEGEVPMNGLYSRYIPVKTTKEYDQAKVVCTGWSDENPANFVRLNAKNSAQMQQCVHRNLILAKIDTVTTNNKNDYMVLHYTSNTVFGNFRFFYNTYISSLLAKNVKVCIDCGYYEIVN